MQIYCVVQPTGTCRNPISLKTDTPVKNRPMIPSGSVCSKDVQLVLTYGVHLPVPGIHEAQSKSVK